VPTLREALDWSKRTGVKIDIDHKSGDVEAIAAAVREAGAIRNVVIEGGYETLARFVRLLPGVDTMPKVKSAGDIPHVCGSLKTTVVRLSIEQLRDPSAVRAVNACGARVSVTILGALDNEAGIAEVIQRGAQLIETDRPDLATKVLAARR
jgi:glycerophosphoryl diester phosphodiesterase